MNRIQHSLRLLFSFIFGLFVLPGCIGRNCKGSQQETISPAYVLPSTPSHDEKEKINVKPTITIWVHGTRIISGFGLDDILYCPIGIKAIKEFKENSHMHKIAQKLSSIDPKRFQMDHFYLFGWSGKLSFNARKQAAQDLYEALKKLTQEYRKQYGVVPTFRIITHSHGGNVALNLATIDSGKAPFTISELILLACPVQERTKQAIESSLFKRVYSFFSRGEFLQVIDPQGFYQGNNLHPFFSKRTFPNNPKLSQAEIKMYGRPLLHVEFLLKHFVHKLPAILDALDKEHAVCNKNLTNQSDDDYVIIDLKKKNINSKRKNKKHKLVELPS